MQKAEITIRKNDDDMIVILKLCCFNFQFDESHAAQEVFKGEVQVGSMISIFEEKTDKQ